MNTFVQYFIFFVVVGFSTCENEYRWKSFGCFLLKVCFIVIDHTLTHSLFFGKELSNCLINILIVSVSIQQLTMIKAQAGVKNNLRRLNKSIVRNGANHVVHVIVFALICFFIVYLWSKVSRKWWLVPERFYSGPSWDYSPVTVMP